MIFGLLVTLSKRSLLLGNAGRLDKKRATTHWRTFDEMRGLFPAVNVIDDKHLVEQDDVITSAGIDMALRVVARHHGESVARTTARYMEYPFPEDNRSRV
jgi:transcriptional regulator GlxA family with amidase domain